MRPYAPHLVIIALLALALALLKYGVDVTQHDQAGLRLAPPAQAGAWTGTVLRYCHAPACGKEFATDALANPAVCPACGAPLFSMTRIEKEGLPPDTDVVKARYTRAGGRTLYVTLLMSGKGRESIHPPQACLLGQGMQILRSRVLRIPLAGRPPLDVMALDLARHWTGTDERLHQEWGYFAYWFVGRGRETPYHLARMFWTALDQLAHNVTHRWAYVAIMGNRPADTDAYRKEVAEFVEQFYPQITMAP